MADDEGTPGIEEALCKRCNANGRLLWLEFIDKSIQPDYVPQYDVANKSGQTIKMLHTALEIPTGVAVKELNQDKPPLELLRDKIPEDVERLLTEKGLMEVYYRLVQLCILDGVGGWILKSWNKEKLVKVVAKLKPRFQAKGVEIFLCYKQELRTKSELRKLMLNDEGTPVANGKHVVPKGVVAEELDGGVKKFAKECPIKLSFLLKCKGARQVYDQFVTAVVETRKTRNVFGYWKDAELNSVLDLFRDKFAQFGIKAALCKRSSGEDSPLGCVLLSATFLWLEFIDTSIQPNYVPQYDVANMSGQTITTKFCTLEFPRGVAVKQLHNNGVDDGIPLEVQQMLAKNNLEGVYNMLVKRAYMDCFGGLWIFKEWDSYKLAEVVAEFKPRFQAKGVDIFYSYKSEAVSKHSVIKYHWLEFVDREQQPNYHAQRDATLH